MDGEQGGLAVRYKETTRRLDRTAGQVNHKLKSDTLALQLVKVALQMKLKVAQYYGNMLRWYIWF